MECKIDTQIRDKVLPPIQDRKWFIYSCLQKAKHLINDNFHDETTKLHE